MSPTSPQSSDPRSLIRYACVALAVTITLLWALYLVRAPLLVIYVSALFSTGLAPLVAFIERQRIMTLSKRRLPDQRQSGKAYSLRTRRIVAATRSMQIARVATIVQPISPVARPML